MINRDFRVNEAIRAKEVRLVDVNGEQLGILPFQEALRIAAERGADLVEVAPQAKPVVCRIMDYGKFKYELSKKEKEARKKQKIVEVKELKLRPKIESHDFEVKVRNASRFLKEGNKIKVTVTFRGREIVHANLAQALLEKMAAQVQDLGIVERAPKLEGKNMVMVLAPRPQDKK